MEIIFYKIFYKFYPYIDIYIDDIWEPFFKGVDFNKPPFNNQSCIQKDFYDSLINCIGFEPIRELLKWHMRIYFPNKKSLLLFKLSYIPSPWRNI